MSVLLQISDPHFGTEQPRVVEALLRLAQAQRPAVTVWSGDITQRARRSQFEAARRFADRLPPSSLQLAIPGNHDLPLFNGPARLLAPYANFRRAFGHELEPSLDTPDWLVIGVNTTRPWRHKHGEVSRAQIDRVAARLRQARPGQLRVVVVHQPVCVTLDKDRQNLLRGHAAALASWGAAGADAILGGHIHLPYVVPQPGFGEGRDRTLWAVQAGTALSSRIRGGVPNSVNLLRHAAVQGRAAVTIERWDFLEARHEFAQVSQVGACGATAP